LIPSNTSLGVDYDFFIFGPNVTCGTLGSAIRCSTTNPYASNGTNNHTGMNETETDTGEGPGPDGNAYIKSLDVLPGESYFIVIDRPFGSSPFDLKWTGSATIGGSPFPDGPNINKPNNLYTCNSSGIAEFDLKQNNAAITSQNNTTLTYHESLADATDNLNPIQGNYSSNLPVKKIFARVENNFNGCSKITDFEVIIEDGPIIKQGITIERCDLDNIGNLDYYLTDYNTEILNGLTALNYHIQFFISVLDAQNNMNPVPSIYNSEGNEILYAKVWENGNPNCYNISEIELIRNTPPVIEDFSLVQSQINANNNSFTLNIPNAENYEFAIGNVNGPYQSSTTFNNISSGFQTLYIKDLKGCAIINSEIAVIGYDNFFTPNNDGINDFWQIKGISPVNASQNSIQIYDRYGKLLQNLNASEKGWNGEFNGKLMPAGDYWFRVQLRNQQEFTGHFSLVR